MVVMAWHVKKCSIFIHLSVRISTVSACHDSSSTCLSSAAGCWERRKRWGRWAGGRPAPSVSGADPDGTEPCEGLPASSAPTPWWEHLLPQPWGLSPLSFWMLPTSPQSRTVLGWSRSPTEQELRERWSRRWDKGSSEGQSIHYSWYRGYLWCFVGVFQWWRGAADRPGCRGHSGRGSSHSHQWSAEPVRLSRSSEKWSFSHRFIQEIMFPNTINSIHQKLVWKPLKI